MRRKGRLAVKEGLGVVMLGLETDNIGRARGQVLLFEVKKPMPTV